MISIDVAKFINHKDYNNKTNENDISLLELAEESECSNRGPRFSMIQLNNRKQGEKLPWAVSLSL